MKKLLSISAVLSLLLFGCSKKDLGDFVQPVDLSFHVKFQDDVAELELPKKGAKVKIVNQQNNVEKEALTNESGVAVFESVAPGSYTVTASITINATDYTQLSGTYVDEDVVFNGNLSQQVISATNKSFTLTLEAGTIGDWVIKQVYYSGSNTARGASFRDQFIEFYNNSNKTLYADSMYFGQVIGVNNNTSGGKAGFTTLGQYDWAQSYGMSSTNPNDDYVYLKNLFMIPGTGTTYPVEPGKSIILAQTALDHTGPYVMADGLTQGITDPTLTVNLANADFEVYMGAYLEAQANAAGTSYTPYKWDVDNPAVPNVKVLFSTANRDLVLDATGRDAYVIFKETNLNSYKYYQLPTLTSAPTAASDLYIQVAKTKVIDAVEIQHSTASSRVPKRMPTSLDAGPTNNTSGQYSSESIVRKTKRTVSGRRILQDTNNSANDFVTKTKADPSKAASSFAD
ncbi:DUF4876 domain-containing protein [Polluticaenibacter yanchengensis]|uniref:DUF4876 domain-containing protein n=1 Tax=Polluticaenibacter yanchengensis TaxID=3014562 RepID=A0ABT4ULU8_9BACT|nr:DUF4876 domain-containing protein [Chitinophagaceae bacterium LY-5]